MPLPFVIYPHAALSVGARPRAVDDAMLAAGAALLAAAQEVQAYGLAAAHLGLDQPLVVITLASDTNVRDYRVLYNPELTALSDETDVAPEGSVSMPGIEAPVKRSRWVELDYDDADGRRQTFRLEGFAARVAQHEIDQMNGVFFLRRVTQVKRDMAVRKFRKRLDE